MSSGESLLLSVRSLPLAVSLLRHSTTDNGLTETIQLLIQKCLNALKSPPLHYQLDGPTSTESPPPLDSSDEAHLQGLPVQVHPNLTPYIDLLRHASSGSMYAVSVQHLHTLHQELSFCLRHGQSPRRQRCQQLMQSIVGGLWHLHVDLSALEGSRGNWLHGNLSPHTVCMNQRQIVLADWFRNGCVLQAARAALDEKHCPVTLFNGLSLQQRFLALHHQHSLYHFDIVYLPPDYFLAHINNIHMVPQLDLDTWAAAVTAMYYVLGASFLEVFAHNALPRSHQAHSSFTEQPPFLNPLIFYSNMQNFFLYCEELYPSTPMHPYSTTAPSHEDSHSASVSHLLSRKRQKQFDSCHSRLKSTLSTDQLRFVLQSIRPTNRKPIHHLVPPPPCSRTATLKRSPTPQKTHAHSLPLSARCHRYLVPTVRCTHLEKPKVNPSSIHRHDEHANTASFSSIDQKLYRSLSRVYFAWVRYFSPQKALEFFQSRETLRSTLPLDGYPSIRRLKRTPSLVNTIEQCDGASYYIAAAYFREWFDNLSQQEQQILNQSHNESPSSNHSRRDSNTLPEESNLYSQRLQQFSCLADVNGDLLKYQSKHSYSFSQMLKEQEKNQRHQLQRVELFRSLLNEYPSTRDRIISEARKDIPPVLRGEIWSCILDVDTNYEDLYEGIIFGDNSTNGSPSSNIPHHRRLLQSEYPDPSNIKTECDRQIAVDVPRCHQYHSKLNCATGRRKLECLLKAWTKYHDGALVYWQGLDSLCAPFVVLNYHDEARAFSCLLRLVDKYVQPFFFENNSSAMEYQLCMFEKLLAYHEPQIAHHMDIIGFKPELYTIPWFLTLFAHVLPIEKIFKLWDHILLDTHLLPLYIAVSFLKQQRSELLHSDFNEMMSVLSNMHHINIEKVVEDSYALQQKTPECILNPRCLEHLPTSEYKELKYPRITADDLCDSSLYQVSLILDLQHPHNYKKRHCTKAYRIAPVREKHTSNKNSKGEEDDSSASGDREWLSEYKIEDGELSLLKANVLHYLQYKRGIPIVLICDSAVVEQEVERHLLRHNYPYVSVVLGGMRYFSHLHQKYVRSS